MPVLLFFGEDLYSMERALETLRRREGFDDVDTLRLDARSSPPQDILLSTATPALLSPRRLVILSGLNEKPKGRKPKKAAGPAAELTLGSLTEATPESTTLVILAAGATGSSDLVKTAREQAKDAGDRLRIQEFAAPKPQDMAGWLVARTSALGGRLEPRAAEQLAARVGTNVSIAGGELEKLVTAAFPNPNIDSNLIEELVPRSAEESIFPLVDAIAAGKAGRSIDLLERQLAQADGNTVELALPLIRLLARQFRILLTIQLMLEAALGRQEIISALRLPPYYADRYFSQAKRAARPYLLRALQALVQTEFAIKNGESQEAYLQLLVADLALAARRDAAQPAMKRSTRTAATNR